MKILHTSDWHLGRTLLHKNRYAEFAAFLDWLVRTIETQGVEVLIVAGDIFDTATPGNRAQQLYYTFLSRALRSCCRHIVVTAGNHDSPSFLTAPATLLHALNIHVVGVAAENPEDEVLVLRDADKRPELIVGAVPYLRDRDLRSAEAGESYEDKERKLQEGIRAHYAAVGAAAEKKRQEEGADLPVILTGHLFTAGGKTVAEDGVRDLYVGSLAQVNASVFPSCADYVALGHLHVPQKVGGSEVIRYSGSPLAMGFGEARQQKSVCLIDFEGRKPAVELLPVPVFQQLVRIKGDRKHIYAEVQALKEAHSRCWLEIIYDGDEVTGNLNEELHALIDPTDMLLLRTPNEKLINLMMAQEREDETLHELSECEVFSRCLDANKVPDAQRVELMHTYQEALTAFMEEDQL